MAKYVVVLFLAWHLTKIGDGIKDFWHGVIPPLCVGGLYAGMVLAQKNLSVAALIMIVTFVLLFVAGGQNKHMFGVVAPTLVAAALVFALGEEYRRDRMLNFLDPWKDAADKGYQLIQSFYALGAGGLTGLGLGQSRQKTIYMPEPHNDFIFSIIGEELGLIGCQSFYALGAGGLTGLGLGQSRQKTIYMPEPHNDFIFSIIGEELGLIGCLVIISLFVFLIWRGIKVAMEARDTYGSLLAMGITSIIGFQAIINIAVVTGSMPVTGVPLPFISYGGTSLAITMTAMGVLLNISRQRVGKED